MALSGMLFLAWTAVHVIGIGVAAAALLALGATIGIIGALRRELRLG